VLGARFLKIYQLLGVYMKKFLVTATAAAVVSALSSGAWAVVNLDDGVGAVNYASQLVVPGTTALAGAGANVTSTLGFGVSTGQTRFIRYDLTNAKFKAAVAAADLVVPTATPVVSQGGAAGSTFVIFQITATANIPQDAPVAFASGSGTSLGLVIQSAASPVQMSYSLYEDAPSAAAGGSAGRLNISNFGAQTVAGLVSGLAFTTVQNTTTVDVAAAPSYTRFLAGLTGTTTSIAQIGTVSLNAATGVLDPITGVQVLYPAIVAAGTSLVLKGDFASASAPSTVSSGVFLGVDGGNCGAAGTAPTPATPIASASFLTGVTPAVAKPLCFTVSATNAIKIPAQTFTVEADITAAVGSTATDLAPIDAGKFVRNGLVLKAAFAETTTASGVATAVSLSNTSNLAAPFTVRCLVNSVSTVGLPGTVPANSSTRLSLGTPGLGCPTTGTMRGIEITFATTPGSVIGSVVRQNVSTGQAAYDGMTGNQ
jgi:hypothetical protein